MGKPKTLLLCPNGLFAGRPKTDVGADEELASLPKTEVLACGTLRKDGEDVEAVGGV